MRWESLFADLEAEFEAGAAEELRAEVRDRTRRETALVRVVDRLRSAVGHPVAVAVRGGVTLQGVLLDAGPDWLLLGESTGREALVPADAVLWLTGLGARSTTPGSEGRVAARLDLRSALRGVARDRSPVAVVLLEGGVLTGTLDRVGADWVELAEHPAGEQRRASEVRGVRTVPLAALAVVRRS